MSKASWMMACAALVVMLTAALIVVGCSASSCHSPAGSDKATSLAAGPAAAAVENVKCPIMGGKVDPAKVSGSLTRQYQGHRIGFCCPGCPQRWDSLTDAEKKAKLTEVLAH